MTRPAGIVAAAALLLALGPSAVPAGDRWLPVREVSLALSPGSPLDFSALLPNPALTPASRIIASPDGHLVRADAPDRPLRLMCASLAWSPASGGFPDHAGADAYARQLALHGYDIARLHFVDASLMNGRAKDFDFDPETLDRVDYLLAALKRNGIAWIIDGMTSWRGAFGDHDDRWDPVSDFKLRLSLDEAAFQHWRTFQERFLARVNPYTGLAPIRDAALALVVLVNENGVEFDSVLRHGNGAPPYDALLAAPFNDWLKAHYADTTALAAAWGGLAAGERLEDGTVRLPGDRRADDGRGRDMARFVVALERTATARQTEALRALGYRGLVTSYNNWPTEQTALSRQGLDVVTINTYHDWASGYAPGSRLEQTSSIADGVRYIRLAAASRWLGQPFVVTEYDHLFWNRFRYEAGLVMPAYAALQGWDGLCRHGHGPIVLAYGEPFPHKRAMLPYAIALDPVARAGETLAALLFRRGDVATAHATLPFALGPEPVGGMETTEPDRLTQLALLSRIGLAPPAATAGNPLAIGLPRAASQPEALLAALRQRGAVTAGNLTDLASHRLESDTGEITLDVGSGTVRLVTPMTEAAVFPALRAPLALGRLRIDTADGGALLALSSIDGEAPLDRARRLLLIFATDARNTDMRFRDGGERVIDDFGHLPVLIRAGSADISLDRASPAWKLSPVGLDGVVHAAMASGSGPVRFRLSNDTPAGPTTYFLLEL